MIGCATRTSTLKREVISLHGTSEIVGNSQPLKDVLARAQQVAATAATVLLLGETGTGKELLAAQIHDRSARRGRLMVRVNCAAIPAALFESELFGREKGAYTGALSRQLGRFEVADRSTIFLDEIGDLPMETQVKLLRVLQEKTFERLGSTRSIQRRRTHHRGDQSRSRSGRRECRLSRRSLLPVECLSDPTPCAERACR